MKAESVFVSRSSKTEAGLRFMAAGSTNRLGEQQSIQVPWPVIRQMIGELEYLDPENYGKPRNL